MKYYRILFMFTLCFLLTYQVFAQSKTITGNIVDSNKEPIVGATVMIKGTTNGTITDVNGNYTIKAESGTLVVSFIGFQTQEIEIGNQSKIDVVLAEEVTLLDDIVAVGYGSQVRKNVTGAVSDVKSDKIMKSAATSISGTLYGQMAGVSVRSSDGRPGMGADIEIRNMGDPLYVIDGISYGGDNSNDWLVSSDVSGADMFNSLNPEDIESISILKDASAAVYGLAAANGVVLVTTKNGRKGQKAKFTFNAYYGVQNLTRFPDLANAADYTRGLCEAAQNAGTDPTEIYSEDELEAWQNGTNKSYNYQDMIIRSNMPQSHYNFNVSGGSDKTTYFVSYGHTQQDALLEDFDYKRDNFQVNLKSDLNDNFTLGTQINGREEITRDLGLQGGDSYYTAILATFYGDPTVSPYANDNKDYIADLGGKYAYQPATFHRDITGYKDQDYKNANINAYLEYKTKWGLSAKGTVSYNYTYNTFDGWEKTWDAYTYDEATDTYENTYSMGTPWRYQTEREVVTKYAQWQVNYEHLFGDHKISLMAGYERSNYEKNYQMVSSTPTNDYLDLLEYDDLTAYGDDYEYQARCGWIGKVNYDYQSKYLIELLGRYDASYLYEPGQEWGFFPGATLGWRISQEPFFGNLANTVNDLKIRFSWGQTGLESGVSNFDYLTGYNYGSSGAVLDGEYVSGVQPGDQATTTLSWVKNTTTNIGFDATLLDYKLTVTADAFTIIRSGLPASQDGLNFPDEVGYDAPNANMDKEGYYGIEGSATWTDQIGELKYSVSANATYSRHRTIETNNQTFGNSYDEYRNSEENRYGGIWWGYHAIGQFQSEEEIKNYEVDIDGANNSTLLPGDLKYEDVNEDGVIDNYDYQPIGYPVGWGPFLSYGANINLQWKGFDLNVVLNGASMLGWNQNYELRNPYNNSNENSPAYLLNDRWHRADLYDDNSEWIAGKYPAIRKGGYGASAYNSDFWLHNVTYLRVKNVQFGYDFKNLIARAVKMDKFYVYVSASNLASFDNVGQYGVDPEITAAGAAVYPQQRVMMVGCNVNF